MFFLPTLTNATEGVCFPNVLVVYQKGDIVKDPMKSIPFLPKIVPGVGWGRVGRGGVGWGGVRWGGVG